MDTTHYKARLESLLNNVTAELSTLASYDAASDNWEALPSDADVSAADENSEADEVEDWNERRATAAVLETDYRNYKRALQKIEEGTYGICEISGEPIEPERLEANPAARTCIAHRDDEATLPL